jgi:energy-coupling factor transport system ATP-binding protein
MGSFTIRNLSFTYPGREEKALNDLSFSAGRGEFITVCGPSGCGKTTLLRHLKPAMAPHGALGGTILFEDAPLHSLDLRTQSTAIGFVQQSPENQIVTDKVWHELAFGLESLGFDTDSIRLRVAETASFFGIQHWFHKDVAALSGGQKQLLNLAAVMVMHPSVLVLDEPTAQLDPIAAADFIAAVAKINRELGTTVILSEHRLDEVFPVSDRVIVLDRGKLLCSGTPGQTGRALAAMGHPMFLAMPVPMRVYAGVKNELPCPVTVREGRRWLDDFAALHTLKEPEETGPEKPAQGEIAVSLSELWFRYEKEAPDVLRGLSLQVRRGEFLAILGGNGTGKTTALSVIAGLRRPYRGVVEIEGRAAGGSASGAIGMLPQNPQALFVASTVEADLREALAGGKMPPAKAEGLLREVSELCHLQSLLTRHPYDLSGGEQQRAALAKVLLGKPRVLLLDEPTKGLDGEFKQEFAGILDALLAQGVAVIMASHDIEFCAEYAERCALFFDGGIVTEGPPRRFFPGNGYYTTAANRMARHRLPGAVTAADVIAACGGESQRHMPKKPPAPPPERKAPSDRAAAPPGASGGLSVRRRITAALIGLALLATLVFSALHPEGFRLLAAGGSWESGSGLWTAVLLLVALMAELSILFAALRPGAGKPAAGKPLWGERRLSRRTKAAMAASFLAVPLTVWAGAQFLGDRKYYFISLLIILETLLPFLAAFEGRKPRARELTVLAVLCALGVAGRAVFFMLPQFKPMTAVVILGGVAFGGGVGFLMGAVSAFASNIFFGQGPWTPWQMLALGLIGALAGLLFSGAKKRSAAAVCVFGALSAVLVYGGILNPASVLIFQPDPTAAMFLLSYAQGLPFDLVHAAATAFFLWLLTEPLLEKLERVRIKYGLMEAAARPG